MLKPLIKYTGGKYKEYESIKQYFPESFNNYFEPFFGGGGVFFRLYNEKKLNGEKHINDFSNSLIEFYQSVQTNEFSNELEKLSDAWDFIRKFGENFFQKYGDRFGELILKKDSHKFVTKEIKNYIEKKTSKCNLNFHGFSLADKIENSLEDKLSRFRKKEIKENECYETSHRCITTSICQAFYFIIRDMYNDWNNNNNKEKYTLFERSSQWLFIREYCFGSMFRFDKNGNFNIPYGGFSYNDKCFHCKIEKIISDEVKNLFIYTDIKCGDFEEIINGWELKEDDFMFLDPPYDSIFTDYDNNGFTKEDHKRLANLLKNCKCKWLIAIGKTDFIENLYKDFYKIEYNKTYMYQARGEYDSKHTKHLVITNYPLPSCSSIYEHNPESEH